MHNQIEFTDDFGSRLRSLGGRISYPDLYKNKYIDIENFFLDATICVYKNARLGNAIENWIEVFGFIISPAKVKKLIKSGHPYDASSLAVFCEKISNSDKKQININCLKSFFQKKDCLQNRNSKATIVNADPLWLKYNIMTPNFKIDKKKFLLDFDYILKNSPEISNRIKGIDIVSSDYQAYLCKEGNDESLLAISRKTYAHYSNIHKVHKRLELFNLFPKSL